MSETATDILCFVVMLLGPISALGYALLVNRALKPRVPPTAADQSSSPEPLA